MEPPSLAGRSAGTEREVQGPGICWRGICTGWLAAKQDREGPVLRGSCHHLPSPRWALAGVHRGWVRKLGLEQIDTVRGLDLAAQRQPEGPGV